MESRIKDLEHVGEAFRSRPNGGVYLAERWLRIRGRDGGIQPLKANAAQLAFERQRGRQNIVLKARQMGMTTWIMGRFFLKTVTTPGTMTLLVAQSRSAAEAMFTIAERMWQHLPDELCDGVLMRSRANVGQMVFPVIGSEFRIASAADENAGRGLSVQNLHCSEVSRWPGNAAETLAGLRAALAPDGELTMESTPNGAYGAFYEEWLRATERASAGDTDRGVVRHFLPWWMEPQYSGEAVTIGEMDAEEQALVLQHGLSAEQIGFRRTLTRSFGALRSQEFAEDAETCFRATGACCFDVSAIEKRMGELPNPTERRRNGALLVWLPPVAGRRYVMAVDSAGGGQDGDYAAVQVLDRNTGMQCAELQEKLRPGDLAREAAKLAREYNDALLVVERNNHGSAVLAHLELSEAYSHILRENGEAGRLTTSLSKAAMIGRMSSLLNDAPERFLSRRLLAECRTFVSGENGKAGAANGSHDDLVMSMALGQMVL